MAYLPSALASLSQSTTALHHLQFSSPSHLSSTIFAPCSAFETHLIRDAAAPELALFEPLSSGYNPPMMDDQGEEGRWTAKRREGPKRRAMGERASPLKERRREGGGGAEDPERCLKAAERLLEVYEMPRAQEHVELLRDQYEGLLSVLSELEEGLKRPIARPQAPTSHGAHQKPHLLRDQQRAAELEEQIRREEMEIFALEQMAPQPSPPKRAPTTTTTTTTSTSTSRVKGKPPIPSSSRAKPSTAFSSSFSSSARSLPIEGEGNEVDPFAKSDKLSNAPARRPAPATGSPRRPQTSSSAHATTEREGEGQTTPRAARIAARSASSSFPSPSPSSPPAAKSLSPAKSRTPLRPTAAAAGTPSSAQYSTRTSSAPKTPGSASAAGRAGGGGGRKSVGGGGGGGARKSVGGAGGGDEGAGGEGTMPKGVTRKSVEEGVARIWGQPTLSDLLRPWALKLFPSSAAEFSVEETLAALKAALDAPPPPPFADLTSSSSITGTSVSGANDGEGEGEDVEPQSPSIISALELQLLYLLLSTFLGHPPSSSLPDLPIALQPAPLSGLTHPTLPFDPLRLHLESFAQQRGEEDLSKARSSIYRLVSVRVVKTSFGRGGRGVGWWWDA